jgi:hypothetical protein
LRIRITRREPKKPTCWLANSLITCARCSNDSPLLAIRLDSLVADISQDRSRAQVEHPGWPFLRPPSAADCSSALSASGGREPGRIARSPVSGHLRSQPLQVRLRS